MMILLRKDTMTCVIRPIPVHFPGAIQSPNEAWKSFFLMSIHLEKEWKSGHYGHWNDIFPADTRSPPKRRRGSNLFPSHIRSNGAGYRIFSARYPFTWRTDWRHRHHLFSGAYPFSCDAESVVLGLFPVHVRSLFGAIHLSLYWEINKYQYIYGRNSKGNEPNQASATAASPASYQSIKRLSMDICRSSRPTAGRWRICSRWTILSWKACSMQEM